MFKSNFSKLMVLTLVHFWVDFCGGLTIPLPEPTLVNHLGTGISTVALIVGGSALLINVVQPASGFFLPSAGLPILLVLGPMAAAMIVLIGFTSSIPIVTALFIISGIGIGIIHPEGALSAHSLSGSKQGLGMSFFLSSGYFGFSLGSLLSGLWVESHSGTLAGFWILGLPSVIVVILVIASGLHKLKGHLDDKPGHTRETPLPYPVVLIMSICIASSVCIIVRFLPIYLVRSFPDSSPQGWGGTAVFATGVGSAAGSMLWGYLSDRFGRGRVMLAVQLSAIPFLLLLFRIRSANMAPVWALFTGFTLGGIFPLTVVLARRSKGLSHRLRMGLSIGGAWGMGEIAFIAGGKYLSHFPQTSTEPVINVMRICLLLVILTLPTALFIARLESAAILPTTRHRRRSGS